LALAELPQHLNAINLGHIQVQEDERSDWCEGVKKGRWAGCGDAAQSPRLGGGGDQLADVVVIVDGENTAEGTHRPPPMTALTSAPNSAR